LVHVSRTSPPVNNSVLNGLRVVQADVSFTSDILGVASKVSDGLALSLIPPWLSYSSESVSKSLSILNGNSHLSMSPSPDGPGSGIENPEASFIS